MHLHCIGPLKLLLTYLHTGLDLLQSLVSFFLLLSQEGALFGGFAVQLGHKSFGLIQLGHTSLTKMERKSVCRYCISHTYCDIQVFGVCGLCRQFCRLLIHGTVWSVPCLEYLSVTGRHFSGSETRLKQQT